VTSFPSIEKVAAYYESKTEALLRRYGPGPRVHYHTGLIDQAEPLGSSVQMLRQQLVTAQERMLDYMAGAWRMRSIAHVEVLDVGCGLGGGAVFWAQEFGSNVTAVTIAPSHVGLVTGFAAQAGVESKVRVLLCDALEVPGERRFDVAVAIDSTCHFPRRAWFRRVAGLLRSGGRVLVGDWFLGRSRYPEKINHHWCVEIGTIEEYLSAARDAGLTEISLEDISHRTVRFWDTTLALIKAESLETGLSAIELAKFEESRAVHALMRQGFAEGELRYMLMSFSRP
jgi:tocopherol O-methyltransferase